MTNFKKNFGVVAVGLLALTFCFVLVAQSAMARSEGRVTATDQITLGNVPLPGSDDIATEVKAPKREARNVEEPVALLDNAVSSVRTRPDVTASVAQGGDTFGTAAVLTGPFPWATPGVFTGTTVGYTYDYDETLCAGDPGCEDVVYSYTPPADVFLDISLCTSDGTDTKVWVIDATTMTEIQCNDDGDDCPGFESHITAFAVTGGAELYIVIGGYDAASAGPYEIVLSEYTEGVDCEAPYPIEFDPGDGEDDDSQDYAIDVTGGGPNSTIGAPACKFWQFTAETAGLFTFSLTYDGTVPVGYLNGLAGNIVCPGAYALDYGPSHGPFVFQAVMMPGWTNILECFDWGEGQVGTLTISREEMTAFNDECADVVVGGGVDYGDLGVGDGYHFIHNVNATLSAGPDYSYCDPVIDPGTQTCGDVWYTWEADATGFVRFDMCLNGDSWDSKMFVYRGFGCTGTEVIDPFGCSDDGCGVFGDGGLVEMECTAGEIFMIRVAGWISGDGAPDATCASEGGMGTGHMDVSQHATTIRPYNATCSDAVVGVVPAGGGTYTTPVNNLVNSGWGSCPDVYNTTDGSIGIGGAMAWQVWDAFSISECTDIALDFCGMDENAPPAQWTNWPQGVNIFTGCPCEGPFVTIPVTTGYWINDCEAIDPMYLEGFRWSRVWEFPGLLPGTYYFTSSCWTMGVNTVGGSYWNPYDFNVNFRGTTVACTYCAATANINSCPPVAGASWIDGVDFGAISNTGTGCNAYEDRTGEVAYLYKGIEYELSVVMGKVGIAGVHDSCNVWIDWNQNSGFAPFVAEINEKINPERLALTWTAMVTPPLDAMEPGEGATGVTMMRVRMASDADGANTPCADKVWGEVEDYMVEVVTLECGDFDIDGVVDADDIAFLRDYYFGGGTAPDYWQRADIDGDGIITLADLIALVDVAYYGGAAICIM